MKMDQGFRLPEPSDKAIEWPARKGHSEPKRAFWSVGAAAWMLPGQADVYGSPRQLVADYGNDWYVLWIERAAAAE
jgi:hypothetical protein